MPKKKKSDPGDDFVEIVEGKEMPEAIGESYICGVGIPGGIMPMSEYLKKFLDGEWIN